MQPKYGYIGVELGELAELRSVKSEWENRAGRKFRWGDFMMMLLTLQQGVPGCPRWRGQWRRPAYLHCPPRRRWAGLRVAGAGGVGRVGAGCQFPTILSLALRPGPIYPFEAYFLRRCVGLLVIELHLLHVQFDREGSDFVLTGLLPQRLQGEDAYVQQINAG